MTTHNMSLTDVLKTPFLFLQEHHRDYKGKVDEALKGIQCTSELSKLFFSDKNIVRIQKLIRQAVFKKTKGKYRLDVDQNTDDVFVVMRAVYLEHGRFLPNQVVRQVKRMNNLVVDEVVPSIITNIKMYYGYLKDIREPLKPIAHPINVNNAGRKTLPSATKTFENIWLS